MSVTSGIRLWGGRLGAAVLGVVVTVVLAIVLLPLLGEGVGAVASLAIGIAIARTLSD